MSAYRDRLLAKTRPHTNTEPSTKSGVITIYVDGSYDPGTHIAGWGWVAVDHDGIELAREWGGVFDHYSSRNITGECEAALRTLKWLSRSGTEFAGAKIVYDYKGLGEWALGRWKAKTVVAKQYIQECASIPLAIGLKLEFAHVRGHCGCKWNEVADTLAELGKTKSGMIGYDWGAYTEMTSKAVLCDGHEL